MQLYTYNPAPNPRRVRIFLAEKAIEIDTVVIDLAAGEQFSSAYRAINPRCTVPALVLDDRTAISEVPAIWHYLEELHPEPPLLGTTPREKAVVTMWERRMELDGLLAVAEAVRNAAPRLERRALVGPHNYDQIPGLVTRGRARTRDFLADLDIRLHEAPFVAGDKLSVADITAVVAVDFAVLRLKLEIPDEHLALKRWYMDVSGRPGVAS